MCQSTFVRTTLTALKSLAKHHRHGRSGWISEMDLGLLNHYIDVIDMSFEGDF